MHKHLIILDRDGVINQDSPDHIKSPEEWIPVPGSLEAIGLLTRAGYRILVATNQSGIGRGLFDEYTLARMHEKMHRLAAMHGGLIEGVFFCPHEPEAGCSCRKPATGLLDRMEAEFSQTVSGAPFVGDSERDLDCARAKGCLPVLVRTGKGARTLDQLAPEKRAGLEVHDDLFSAATALLFSRREPPVNVL